MKNRFQIYAFLAAVLLFLSACANISGSQTAEEATPAVTAAPVTPPSVTVAVEAESTPVVTAEPTPTPTATPTPSPIPFSYYAPSIAMSFEELIGSLNDMTAKTQDILKDGYPSADTYYVIVDIYWQMVLVYMKGDDGNPDLTQPVRYMLCSTGSSKIGAETQRGTHTIGAARVRFGDFANGDAAQYWVHIDKFGKVNNGRTYMHSILYKKSKDLSTYDIQSYNNLGSKASHACIRLTVPDARWIYYNCAPGTICLVRDGSKNDQELAVLRAQMILPAAKEGLKLKAGETPWTDNWVIADVKHEVEYEYLAPPPPPDDEGSDGGSSSESSSSESSGDSGASGDSSGGENG